MDSKAPDTEDGVDLVEGDQPLIQNAECRDNTASIFKRLWLASNTVGAILKDGQTNGGGNYRYTSHDYITARAKEAFHKVGVYHYATVTKLEQSGNRTTLEADLHFVSVDNPKDTLVTHSAGHGVDNQDKGIGKAFSYAVKYGLSKALMLNTNEDIEADNIDYDDGHSRKVVEAQEETKSALEAWAKTFKSALTSAQTVDEVKALEKDNKSRLTSANMPAVTREFFIDLIVSRKGELS